MSDEDRECEDRDLTFEPIRLEYADAVATITIDRPDHRNAITGQMVAEMRDVLDELDRRRDVRVVVLTGRGDRFFCPGADLDASTRGGGDPTVELLDPAYLQVPVLLHEMPHVTVAAVNGACAGAGLGWAAGCDLRIASSSAVFNTAFLDIGVAGDMGLPWSLSRLVGGARARELLFLRGKFSAAEAWEMGLVAAVHHPEVFRHEVGVVVERLRTAAPNALRTLKRNIVAAERMSFSDLVDLETERHFQLVTGPEFQAGVEAFLGGRQAR